MQLYVAHKDEQGNTTRYFSTERPTLQNIRLFENFYFWLESTQLKYYDVEVKEDHIQCHIDVLEDETWKTITKPDEKRKYSFNGLQKLTQDAHITFYKSKGISYSLLMYLNIKNKEMIKNHFKVNSDNISKAEAEIMSQYA
ncbi:hypothetical protein [Pseudomonas sp. HY7a-MNA-CIBAN-0227]|uniref:hypothetical protein n=1 Tax=Pseudomonas sp. HY7a-MNA-CIBAN-0227 TaxID=3140474 RepID=UPI00331789A2